MSNFVAVNRIFTHIQYLLLHHDCVVIPSVGAFVVRYRQAHISSDGTQFAPPAREVSFNVSIEHDDGLLISSVSRSEDITYEEASVSVMSEVTMIRHSLDTTGILEIPRVGKLIKSSGTISFEPTVESPIDNAAFCMLPSLTLNPICVEESQPVVLPVSRVVRLRRVALRAARYAAVATGLIFVSVMVSTPLLVKDAQIDRASMSLPKVTAPKVITINQPVTEQSVVVDAVAQSMQPIIAEPEVKPLVEADYKYYVVVSSWETERQAKRYIAEVGGDECLNILHADGRYRVYVKATDDYAAATAYAHHDETLANTYSSAWVYTRR